jgi:hypothetical protein
MTEQFSELVEISRLNGNFKRNYGKWLAAYLYLRSVSAARGRPFFWGGLLAAIISTGTTFLEKYSLPWLRF